jgi:hypothetical protein
MMRLFSVCEQFHREARTTADYTVPHVGTCDNTASAETLRRRNRPTENLAADFLAGLLYETEFKEWRRRI